MPKERILPGKISYKKLFDMMTEKGIKKNDLRNLEPNPIHQTTIQKIIAGNTINTDTIIILCHALGCQPGDIMEYVPSKEANQTTRRKPRILHDMEEIDRIFGD
ncbi:MAG: helix-turn-helix transcriptional regulator [Lachnospiraceae bacterium]|nr:helix-turn-helix transcriptional regulator [Lachnospiraceae bacterium]